MKKKILFIDRDGVLINECPPTYQIDSLEKLEFYPHVFRYLRKIATECHFELVMVSNQDGLGSESFPEETFWPIQKFILKSLENEGIHFSAVHIDRTFPEENAPTRKPGTGLLTQYLTADYDLPNSFVIGDRITDMQLARNLGCKGIWLKNDPLLGTSEVSLSDEELNNVVVLEAAGWEEVYKFLRMPQWVFQWERKRKESLSF